MNQTMFEGFINTFDINYKGRVLKTLDWCFKPIKLDNGYTHIIRRNCRPCLNIDFHVKYDNNIMIVYVLYDYYDMWRERKQVTFQITDYKKNTFNHLTVYGDKVHFYADQEIETFINHFNEYYLELNEEQLTEEEYIKFKYYLMKKSLLDDYYSDYCDYDIEIFYDGGGIVLLFNFTDNIDNKDYKKEFLLYRNRIVGDTYYDIDIKIHDSIITRFDEIVCNFYEFILFLK
jgi:hypothetical protein